MAHVKISLTTAMILISQLSHYLMPTPQDILTVIISCISLLAVIYLSQAKLEKLLPWFNWRYGLIGCSALYLPLFILWVVITNSYYDGVIWALPYIPIINLYDIAQLLVLAYAIKIFHLVKHNINACLSIESKDFLARFHILFITISIIGAWILSSVLVRTLHTYAGTPLWINGALGNEKVQICLTIFWTISAFLIQYKLPKWLPKLSSRFDLNQALIVWGYLFSPLLIIWVVITNVYYDGVVWGLPYIPILNLYDIALLLVLAYGLNLDNLRKRCSISIPFFNINNKTNILLKTIGIAAFWILSSILIRTLHTYASTPLWLDGAWFNDKVQTSLTILWTLTALIATFASSHNGKRFWWFMGISLLGLVVFKLILIDLSQTKAIWRVISFIVAGSLILVTGYLAPLPPEDETEPT